jgi:signal transduction histidine kinase
VLALVSFAALLVHSARRAIDHRVEADYSKTLRTLKAADPGLNEEVLRSRAGLVTHYDGLIARVRELRRVTKTLGEVPSFLDGDGSAALKRELEGVQRAVSSKGELIERFKTHNAISRNSLHFLPVVVARTSAEARGSEIVSAAQALVSSALLLDVAPDRESYERLTHGIEALALLEKDAKNPALSRDIAVTLQHARLIAKHKPLVDSFVARILDAPVAVGAMRVEAAYSNAYQAALDAATNRQRAFFVLAFLIAVLFLTDVILRVQRTNAALATATKELRRANAALALEREKERELGELKTRFVAMTTHEFRTPLSAILSSGELLSTYGAAWDRERTASHLERIQASARHMSQMLEEILLIGRAEAGALKPQPALVELDAVCRRLVSTLDEAFGKSHPIRLEFSGEASVELDERLLTHVLTNLLENALKYSPRGSEILLKVEATDTECRFVVKDRGIGIADGDMPHLFTSFERGRNVGNVTGSGLGLAVVRRVLDVQGGTIDVKSTLGQGSEFIVTLPSQAPDPEPEARAS